MKFGVFARGHKHMVLVFSRILRGGGRDFGGSHMMGENHQKPLGFRRVLGGDVTFFEFGNVV